MSPTDLVVGAIGGAVLTVSVTAAVVHYKYARDGHRGARKALKLARQVRLARLRDLVRAVALVVLIPAGLLVLYWANHPGN